MACLVQTWSSILCVASLIPPLVTLITGSIKLALISGAFALAGAVILMCLTSLIGDYFEKSEQKTDTELI